MNSPLSPSAAAAARIGPVVAVVGVTASGKSDVAMHLGAAFDGELVCADSRTVYRGLDIGSAKPTCQDRSALPHHLLDILDPGELITGAAFGSAADACCADIADRGHLAIVVGGTRLFVTTSLFHTTSRPPGETDWIDLWPLGALYERFAAAGVALPLSWSDRDALRRVWADNRLAAVGPPRRPTLIVGVRPHAPDVLATRVRARIATMLAAGLEEEVAGLCARWGCPAREFYSIGYEEWDDLFCGRADRAAVAERIAANTLVYASRQARWLAGWRPGPGVRVCWVDRPDEAAAAVEQFLYPS